MKSNTDYENPKYQVHKYIKKIYDQNYIRDMNNNKIKLKSHISPRERYHLYKLIKKFKIKKTLEVGCANGISTLYILSALHENMKKSGNSAYNHTAIDPYQTTQWNQAGLINVRNSKMNDIFTLIEDKSYNVLPHLLQKFPKYYDMIFIDGFHTFDYTLIDFFYSDLLLKINGFIVIDDIRHKGVKKCLKYILTNYKHYKLYKSSVSTMATLRKVSDDNRAWDYHNDF
jgi:predicted O-methyltransferase YrrM